ncbi:MAG: hypothetical protein ACOCP8_06310 [archaeon]
MEVHYNLMREQYNYIKYFIGEYKQMYFISIYLDPLCDDYMVASILQMKFHDYADKLVNEFNAIYIKDNNGLFFKNKQDAEKALEWVESREIIIRLSENS